MKNTNQITLPAGVLLVLIGIVCKFLLPSAGITVTSDWLSFLLFGGFSFILLSIGHQYTMIAGFILLAMSLISLTIALT